LFTPAGTGTAVVTAISTQDSSKVGSASISVIAPANLSLVISDLPAGTPAAVTVVDPNGNQTLVAGSRVIAGVPGDYAITAASVTVGSSTYHATQPTQLATIPAGNTTGITVDYRNVVPATTKILDSAAEDSLSVSSDGLTLTMFASPVALSLNVGDVLIASPTAATGPAPKGLIREVLSAVHSGQQVVVTTDYASLSRAFQRLAMNIQQHLTTDAIASIQPAPGVTFRTSGVPRGSVVRPAISSLSNPCKGFSLGIFDIPKPISASLGGGISVSGSVELCSGLDLSADLIGTGFLGLVPQLNSFSANTTFGDFGDLTVTAAVAGSASSGRLPLAKVTFKSIKVPDLPLWVTPEAVLFVGGTASTLSSVSSEASTSATISKGISWMSSGSWTTTPLLTTSNFDFQPPAFLQTLDAKEYAGVELSLYAYDILGIVFAPEGFYELQANTSKLPLWTLTAGFEGPVSLRAKMIGIDKVLDYDLGNAFAYSKVIAAGPVLQTLSPEQEFAESTGLTLAVKGANFTDAAVVKFGDTSLATSKLSSTQLTAVVPASRLLTPGMVQVTVDDFGAGGNPLTDPVHFAETSNALPFTVLDPMVTITPAVVSLAPSATQVFAAAVTGGGQIDWSIVEGASGGSITNFGLYTAPSAVGIYHVRATNHADPSHYATAIVNVSNGIRQGKVTIPHGHMDFDTYVIPWNIPFATTDYWAVCTTGIDFTSAFTAITAPTPEIVSKSLSSMTVTVITDSSYDYSVSLSCIAADSDYHGHLRSARATFPATPGMPLAAQTLTWNTPLSASTYVAVCTPIGTAGINDGQAVWAYFISKTASTITVGFDASAVGGDIGGSVDCVAAEPGNGEISAGSVGISSDYTDFPPSGHQTGTLNWDKPFSNTSYIAVCGVGTSLHLSPFRILPIVMSQDVSSVSIGLRADQGAMGVIEVDCLGIK
jgi:hypothetical protein